MHFSPVFIFPSANPFIKPFEESNVETRNSSEKLNFHSKKISKKRDQYQRIDNNVRQKLIKAVTKEGQMLKDAAVKLNLNYSSAKSIFYTYKKEGRINKKAVRERKEHYLKKRPKTAKMIHKVNPSQSDSESSPQSEDSPKHMLPSKIDIQKSLKVLQETQAVTLPQSSKNYQVEPCLTNSNPLLNAYPVSKISNISPQTHYTALNNHLQSPNITQYLINQANTMRLYDEITQLKHLQRKLTSSLAVGFDEQFINNINVLPTYPTNMMALQNQMQNIQAIPFGFGDIQNQMPYIGTVPSINGFQNFGFNPSGYIERY